MQLCTSIFIEGVEINRKKYKVQMISQYYSIRQRFICKYRISKIPDIRVVRNLTEEKI